MKNNIKIVLLSVLVLLFVVFSMNSINAVNAFAEQNQKAKDCIKTDAEIALDSIIVTLTADETRKFKSYVAEDFNEIDCLSVEDLTQSTAQQVKAKIESRIINQPTLVEYSNYKRILKLEISGGNEVNIYNAIDKLNDRADVYMASPNYIYNIDAIPNDVHFEHGDLWGLNGTNGIHAEEAWDISTGSNIVVGVMDTGIQGDHPDLSALISDGDLHRDCTNSPITAVNSINLVDPNGHGTHVAGIIGAHVNNSIGVSGVCWNIELVSLRVFDETGSGNSGSIVRAINYATSQGIPILNLSGGFTGYDSSIESAIANYNGTLVCAAGNGGEDSIGDNNDVVHHYPSDYSYNQAYSDRVISVGAINRSANKTGFSNYGQNTVSIYAPGDDILSTYPQNFCTGERVSTAYGMKLKCECKWQIIDSESDTWGWVQSSTHHADGYHFMNGTSMATPYVTGVAALMLSENPSLLGSELKSALLNNSDIITINTPTGKQTVKKLNAYRAVSSVALQMNGGRIIGLDDEAAADLKYVMVPELFDGTPVVEIGDYAFANYSCLERIEIPDGIAVSKTAFEGCLQLENIVKKSYLVHDTGDLSTTFTDWVTLETLHAIDGNLLYNMGKRELSITYTADFEVFGTVEYELRLCQNNEELSKASFKPGDGKDHTRIHTFDPIMLSDSSETMRLDIQIRYRKTNWLWGGDFTVTGNKTEIDLIQGENVDIQEGMVIENGKLSAFYQPVGFDGELEIPYGVTEIEEYVFNKGGADSFDLIKITIPNSVTKIDDGAFQSCMDLETVKFAANSNLREIGANAFYECIHLQDIIFPETLEAIGERAFMFCSALQEIEIPENITEIGSEAFFECNNISVINYNAINCTSFGTGREVFQDFFNVSSDLEVYIGENVTVLPEKLFSGMRKIHSIIIPDSVTLIKDDAFSGCNGLNSIILSNSVTSIGENAFNCDNLQNVYYYGTSLIEWENINIADGNTALINAKRYYYSDLQPTIPGNYWHFDGTEPVAWTPVISWSGATVNGVDGTSTTTQITLTFSQDPGEDFSVDNIILEGAIKGELQGTGETRVLTISDISVNNGDRINISIIPPEGYILTGSPKAITVFLETHNIIYKDVGGESFSGSHEPGYPTQHIGGRTTYLDYPTKVNHVFEGWYLEEDGSGSSMTYLSETGYIGDITLYAKWVNIEGFEFNLINDGTAYEISKGTAILNSKLVIPSTYNGLPVVKIADSGFSSSRISEVVIPGSIITIGEKAFKWSEVEIITFEGEISLEVIGSEAFAYCYNLNNIIIPASTKIIDTEAFYQSALESITFAGGSVLESIGDSAFAYATIGNIEIPAGVQSIGVEAFYSSELESITFSANIALESISNSVFARATIGSIEIPASVQSIEAEAFEYTNLENITFSADSELESIGDLAFAHATLGNINIPAGVQSIGVRAFYASNLGSITFSAGSELGSIGNSVFAHAEFSSINVPAGVQSLGTQAFYSSDFESITFAANSELKSIGNSAFAYAKFNSIEIPAGVQSIGAEAFSSSDLKSITFAANSALESIGSLAFSKCDLSSINIPVNVRTIGDEVFLDAEALTSVTFAENSALENIGEDAFRGCEQLTGIIIPENVEAIGSGAFFGTGLSSVTFPENGSLEDIGNSAFYGCDLIEVSIPESVIHIGDSAFSGNGSLSTVNIPTGSILESIGKTAFKGCNIESIHIPGNVISIGAEAFRSNFNLEEIVFASNAALTTIGNYAFADCDKLTSFYLPANVSDIGNAIVYGNSLIQLSVDSQNLTYTAEGNCIIRKSDNVLMLGCRASIIPQYVTSIADYAFYECQELTNITIPDTVTSIGEYAFAKCGITTIALPKVTFIGEWAFRDCELEQVSFSNTLVEIDAYAFWNCQLTELVLPNSIRTIGTSAFSGCDSLENVAFPEGLMSIGRNAFYSCENLISISIPASVDSIGDGAFSFCLNLESITVDKANAVYSGDGNCIIRKSDNTLLFGFKTSIIPNYVQKIGKEAFYRSKILSLDIPYGVTEIGEQAFWYSSITHVTLPNSITIIGAKAFEGCHSLTELIIPESVTSIGDEAFYSCSGLKEITVPANVVSMGEYVFGSWNEDQVIYVEAPASMLEVWNTKWLADCYARIEWEAAEDYFTPGLEFIEVDGMSYVVAAGTSLSSGRETVVIPATYEGYPVVGIADYGFYTCEVTNIVFAPNDEFVSIGEYAFAESGLKSINLPNTIEYIGQYAFARCYDLAITLPDTMGWLDVDDTWFDESSGITVYTEYYRWDIDEKFVDILAGSGCIVWECVLSEEDSHVIAIVHSEDNIYDYDLVNPYRKGYEFIGWSTVPDSTEAEYTSEDLINWNVPMEEDSIILYAVWVALED